MTGIFGPHTCRLVRLLADLSNLGFGDLGTVATAWWDADDRARAEAWVEVHCAVTDLERYRILAAASVARRAALEVAARYRRTNWGFWVAATEAGAALAAGDRIGSHYDTLVSALATAVPWIRREDVQVRQEADVWGARRTPDGVLPQGA